MANDLLRIMHDSGKYEVAELASYIDDKDPRIGSVPWKVYPVIPTDPAELERYQANYQTAQFGSLRFDRAVLDFKPDVVFSYRDFWHDEWICKAGSRHLFNYVWSTCVDSEPPRSEWIGVFSTVDVISSYTDWGLSVIKEYSGKRTNIANVNTMPGVDQEVFKPMPKEKARQILGIKDDVNLVLTVMRNQPRKLFPDLMYAFGKALDSWKAIGRGDLADNTYLYLHTSYPDVGFDIGKDIIKYKLGSKVLMTYCCNQCGNYFASFFNGEVCSCNKCKQYTAHPPNTALGLTREQLATVYNTSDLYVQLSVAGALEIPLIEAKACGVPTIATDYAAMHELNSFGGSYGSVKVAAWREESERETGKIRARPYPNDCADKICSFFLETPSFKANLAAEALNTARLKHTNKETYNKWDSIFDRLPKLSDDRWYQPPRYIDVNNINLNAVYNDDDFIDYLIYNFTPPKSSIRSYAARKSLLANLKSQVKSENGVNRRLDRSDVTKLVVQVAQNYNGFETFRYETMNNIQKKPKLVEVV
jgi:glycosyltransferase involved in cell wall biosynthesis